MDEQVKTSVKSNVLFYICIVLLTLNYWTLFDMAFAGIKHDYKNIGGELIINGLIYWYVWKRNGWKPMYGVVIGVVVYSTLLLASGVVAIRFAQ